MQFWIIRNGESVGPLTIEQLKALNIDRQTKIWYESLTEWTPAADTPYADEIFSQAAASTTDSGNDTPQTASTSSDDMHATESMPTNDNISTESASTESDTFSKDSSNEIQSDANAQQTPPSYNPQNNAIPKYNATTTPPFRPQPPYINSYFRTTSESDSYMDGYRKGLEDAKRLDDDTDISKCPPTNLVWAILSTVLCCLPFGIVAIIYASKVTSLYNQHEYLKAKKASDKALYWALGSAIAWMVTYPIISALSFALF